MWYAVETAFIKGKQYKSILLFDKNVKSDSRRAQPGTCLADHNEAPHNMSKLFLNNEIEIHTDWFQTKEQAEQFKNGGITYIVHEEVWYDSSIRTVRSRFMHWETVPANGKYLPFHGAYEYHCRDGKDAMIKQLLRALMNAKNEGDKEASYHNLSILDIYRDAADKMVTEMKKGQS